MAKKYTKKLLDTLAEQSHAEYYRSKRKKLKPKKARAFDLSRYIINVLRRASYRLRSRTQALDKARVHYGKYKCAKCEQIFERQKIQVDHIDPVVPISGFTTWDEYIARLFCGPEGLQILCKPCHKQKSVAENKERRIHAKK